MFSSTTTSSIFAIEEAGWRTYLSSEPQLLLFLLLCILVLCKLPARKLPLVEARQVLFARGWVEIDFLFVHGFDLALFRRGRGVAHFVCVVMYVYVGNFGRERVQEVGVSSFAGSVRAGRCSSEGTFVAGMLRLG